MEELTSSGKFKGSASRARAQSIFFSFEEHRRWSDGFDNWLAAVGTTLADYHTACWLESLTIAREAYRHAQRRESPTNKVNIPYLDLQASSHQAPLSS